jgi:hypothetical protein
MGTASDLLAALTGVVPKDVQTPGANSRKVWTLYLRQQREESDAADAPTPPSGETGTAPSRRCIA